MNLQVVMQGLRAEGFLGEGFGLSELGPLLFCQAL